jgi:hypothetical protein
LSVQHYISTSSGKVWKAGIKEFKHISSVKVKKTEIKLLAKPGININANFIDLNVTVSSAYQFGNNKDK